MKKKFYSFLLTALLGMTGMNAWAQALNTTVIDGVEFYEISTADDLAVFGSMVNAGETTINGVLTEDIDMSGLIEMDGWTPIGDWNSGSVSSAYCGHFDGQGHTITGFNGTSSQNYYGIFGVVSTGCLIENFTVYGSITTNIATAGVVGYARDATPTIRNIHSYLDINNTRNGSRLGGILGSSVNGTVIVDRCTYSGRLDGNDNAGNGNYGGIVGYLNNNANAHLRVTNCLFDGLLVNSADSPGNCTFGGIVGYVGANPDVTISNCLSVGTLESAVTGQFYGAVKHNTCSIINSFYMGDNINGSASTVTLTTQQVTEVTEEQLASGEIAYKLNGNQEVINWFQKLKSTVFIAEQYVVTANGTARDPETANTLLVDNGNGTYTFVLPNFVLHTSMMDIPVGDVSLDGITIDPDGTFNKTGTFDVPDENIPPAMSSFKSALQGVPYTLSGKVNGEKLYANITDIAVNLGNPFPAYQISVEVGTDDFVAAAPTGDKCPSPNGTYIVYANGSFNCDMTPKAGSEVIYSNTENSIIDGHNFVDGFCSVCGEFDPTYMAANGDGFFEIATPNQLFWFANYTNLVEASSNAILTANIDMRGYDWVPIGKDNYFTGIFDGQNFAISNFNYIGSGDYNGLFGKVKKATIQNFTIGGTLICAGNGTGVVGWSEGSTISNVHSALTIETPVPGAFHHAGGIVGSARPSSTVGTKVERCSFSGTLTVSAQSYDCFGGIAGYTNDYCIFNHCINYGTVSFAANNCYAGGIIGYVNNTNCKGSHNCLNVGSVIYTGDGSPSYSGAIVGRLRGNTPELWGNSYYLEGSAVNANGETQLPTNFEVSELQLSSGEVAAKLAPYIRQNIGEEDVPCLDPTHNVVAQITSAGFASLYVPDTDITIPAGVEAYVGVKNSDGEYLTLNAISGSIAADEPVILAGAAGIYSFTPTTGAAKAATNALKGTAEDIEANGKFILAQPEGEDVGLYLADSGTIRAGKAYLESTSGVKGFKFMFGDDATSISSIDLELNANQVIYNAAGQRLQKMQKGINIVGSKKVLY